MASRLLQRLCDTAVNTLPVLGIGVVATVHGRTQFLHHRVSEHRGGDHRRTHLAERDRPRRRHGHVRGEKSGARPHQHPSSHLPTTQPHRPAPAAPEPTRRPAGDRHHSSAGPKPRWAGQQISPVSPATAPTPPWRMTVPGREAAAARHAHFVYPPRSVPLSARQALSMLTPYPLMPRRSRWIRVDRRRPEPNRRRPPCLTTTR